MRTSDLAPDDANLGAPDCLLCAVDVGYPFTSIPLCRCRVVDALEFEEGCAGSGVSLAALVGNVLALDVD